MMLLASLMFLRSAWLGLAIGLLIGTVILLLWGYHPMRSEASRWLSLSLKFLGLITLVFCLLEPFWSTTRARPGENLIAILADNSLSMRIKDTGESRSRSEHIQSLLGEHERGWQAELAGFYSLKRYLFDTRLQSTEDFRELSFDGPSTALGKSLQTLAERYRGRPLAGVILCTDGNATDLAGAAMDFRGVPPVYPVVIGQRESLRDLSLQQVHASQTPFEDAPVTIQADAMAAGFDGQTITAQLLESDGKIASQQTARVRRNPEQVSFRFQIRPGQEGLLVYQVRVAAQDVKPIEDNSKALEATQVNNSRLVLVNRGRGPYRILYVAGRPNWEYKFLNRALQEDPQLQLTAIIRVAKREPKFEFRGRPGETGNPLFRGFGTQTREEVERYDQPVLVRLNTRDEFELRSGFPQTPEELYAYHAVILDDVEAEFFKPDQASLLQKYVSERGGGLLMLGGMESFQQGQYLRTPIGDLMPVYLDSAEPLKPPGPVRLSLSREGWLQPWARLRQQEDDEKNARQNMPLFHVFNPVRALKPGAGLIATAADENGKEYPALAVQRFGRGRTAAMLVGDLWRWGMQDAEAHQDMDKTWRQLMRWLVADVPPRIELSIEPAASDIPGAVQLQARVRDTKFQALDSASVQFNVQGLTQISTNASSNAVLRLPAELAPNEAGLFHAVYVPRLTGAYRVQVLVTNNAGLEEGTAEAGWTTDLQADELRSLVPNVSLLEDIAHKTGGEVVPAQRLTEFARNLPRRQAPIQENWSFPLWHTPLLFGLALACFLGEWGLRRWKGWP